MITETDSLNTLEFANFFVIMPSFVPSWNIQDYIEKFKGKPCSEGFRYNSGTNSEWLTVVEIRTLVREHVDAAVTI